MRTLRARLFPGLTALTLALALASPDAWAGGYTFTNFDGPGDFTNGTTVDGINGNGQVVGFSTGVSGAFTNFIRNTDGSFTTLTFTGSDVTIANGINNSDQVVGMSGPSALFIANGGNTVTPIPSVNGTTTAEAAFGINNQGTIVGQYTDSNTGTSPGFVYSHGTFTTLNPVANDMQVFAQGINNNGLVVGFYNTDGIHDHGFLYDSNTMQYTLLPDPVVPNLLFTQFLGINDQGEAVGYYQNTTDGSQYGFLYNIATQQYTFLNDPDAATSGFTITQITGINDSAEITGFYVDANSGLQRGFVATGSVPEPNSMALLGVGVTLFASYFARRARRLRAKS